MLSREEILKADDRKTERVSVPEWGGEVIVASMSGADRDEFEAAVLLGDGKANLKDMRARMVVTCCVDEKGARLFKLEDIPVLTRKNAAALERIAQVAQRLNRLGNTQLEELKGN